MFFVGALLLVLWMGAELFMLVKLGFLRKLLQQSWFNVPVICTGGFQTASVIVKALEAGDCDAVSAARPLVANNDLVEIFRSGRDQAEKPCTYCNKCLVNVVENPLVVAGVLDRNENAADGGSHG